MFRVLFVLFVIIPIIEIAVLMNVGAWLGVWPTIFIVVLTAWLGAKNVRQQGLATMNSVQTKLAQGQAPSDEIVAGLMLLVAGVLLVTPGFVTDFFGLSLLVPKVRAAIVSMVQKHMVVNQSQFGAQGAHFYQHSSNEQAQQHSPFNDKIEPERHQGQTIDGEYERKE
ncbi:FxsA family protein [Thalassotalea sp. PLHSN55]|uniref:FxsA family protein n=1 Tax=Thalassotalea sp. PLHSN55 TaxID=3435888 RepID=UPI003F829073